MDSPAGDASSPMDGGSTGDVQPPVVCDQSSGGAFVGVCPAGWHCDLRQDPHYGPVNLCCPAGQTGTSDQCINPQN